MNTKKTIITISITIFTGLSLFYSTQIVQAIGNWSTWFRANNNTTITVNAHGVCQKVTNSSGINYFIPTKSASEWSSFRSNRPSWMNIWVCEILYTPSTNIIYNYNIPSWAWGVWEWFNRTTASWTAARNGTVTTYVNICGTAKLGYFRIYKNGSIIWNSNHGHGGIRTLCSTRGNTNLAVNIGDVVSVTAYLWWAYGSDRVTSGTLRIMWNQ